MKIYKLVFLLCVIIVMVGGAFIKLSDYRLLPAPMYYSGKMHFLPDVELLINCDSGVEGVDSFINEIILSSKDESADVWSQVALDSEVDQSVLKKRRGFFSKINSVDIFCTYKRGGRYYSLVTVLYGESSEPMTTFLVFKEDSQGDLVYLVTLPSKDDGFTNAVAYWWEYATKEQRAGASLGIVGLVKLLKGDFVAENGVAVLSQFEKPDPSSKLLESYEFSEQLSEILVYENGAAAVLGDGSLLFFTQESDNTFTLVDPSLIPPFPRLINEIIGWPKDGYFEKFGGVL